MPRQFIILFIFVGLIIFIVAGYSIIKTLPWSNVPYAPTSDVSTTIALTIGANDPVLGNSKAPTTIVEFSDFECEFCKNAADTLKQLITKYPDKIRVVWKDMPNERLHFNAFGAHVAARCAFAQNKFWEFHDLAFAHQDQLNAINYIQWAKDLGLDSLKFQQCLAAEQGSDSIGADQMEGINLGIDATPYFFIGTTRLSGAVSLQIFEQYVK